MLLGTVLDDVVPGGSASSAAVVLVGTDVLGTAAAGGRSSPEQAVRVNAAKITATVVSARRAALLDSMIIDEN